MVEVQLYLTVCNPMDCSLPGSSVLGILWARILEWKKKKEEYWRGLPFLSPGGIPNPGIKPRPPALQADSLPFEPPRKPDG